MPTSDSDAETTPAETQPAPQDAESPSVVTGRVPRGAPSAAELRVLAYLAASPERRLMRNGIMCERITKYRRSSEPLAEVSVEATYRAHEERYFALYSIVTQCLAKQWVEQAEMFRMPRGTHTEHAYRLTANGAAVVTINAGRLVEMQQAEASIPALRAARERTRKKADREVAQRALEDVRLAAGVITSKQLSSWRRDRAAGRLGAHGFSTRI